MIQQTGKTIKIAGFLTAATDQDSPWSVVITPGMQPDAVLVHLHWADKTTPTHSVHISKSELKRMIGEL